MERKFMVPKEEEFGLFEHQYYHKKSILNLNNFQQTNKAKFLIQQGWEGERQTEHEKGKRTSYHIHKNNHQAFIPLCGFG